MAHKRNRSWIEPFLWWLIVPGLALAAVGFALAERYEATHRLSTKLASVGLTELGFAFLISAIVYRLFEEAMKRDEAKSITAFLYGIETESNYFKMIEDYIIRCPFYRFETAITYKFLEKSGEWYLIDYAIEYDVINFSKVKQKFQIRGEVETQPIHGDGDGVEWELGLIDHEVIKDGDSTKPEMHFSQAKSSVHTKAFLSDPIWLPPRKSLHVRLQHRIRKHDHGYDVWQAVMPCSGVKLRLEWQEQWCLRFMHEAFHPNADDLVEKEGCENSECWKELDLQEPFIARHGLHFSWTDKSGAKPPASVAAPGSAGSDHASESGNQAT